jgi:hypothetical protein
LPNLQYAGNILILEGTTGAGTEAAGDFMTDPQYASQLPALFGLSRKAASLLYFEILLKTTVLDNAPGELQVVAHRTLHAAPFHNAGMGPFSTPSRSR